MFIEIPPEPLSLPTLGKVTFSLREYLLMLFWSDIGWLCKINSNEEILGSKIYNNLTQFTWSFSIKVQSANILMST